MMSKKRKTNHQRGGQWVKPAFDPPRKGGSQDDFLGNFALRKLFRSSVGVFWGVLRRFGIPLVVIWLLFSAAAVFAVFQFESQVLDYPILFIALGFIVYSLVSVFTYAISSIASNDFIEGKNPNVRNVTPRALRATPKLFATYLIYYLPVLLLAGAAIALNIAVEQEYQGLITLFFFGFVVAAGLSVWALVKLSLVGVSVANGSTFVTSFKNGIQATSGFWFPLLGRMIIIFSAFLAVNIVFEGFSGSLISSLNENESPRVFLTQLLAVLLGFRIVATLLSTLFTSSVQVKMLQSLSEIKNKTEARRSDEQ